MYPYSSLYAKAEKTAVHMPSSPAPLSRDNRPREVLVYSKSVLFVVHEEENRSEKQEGNVTGESHWKYCPLH